MRGEWDLSTGDEVFFEAKDEFYQPFLRGWFQVDTVVHAKDRFTVKNETTGDTFKMFRNKQGVCCVVEHEYDKYGMSTWDEHRQQYRFIFVPVDLYVKTSN